MVKPEHYFHLSNLFAILAGSLFLTASIYVSYNASLGNMIVQLIPIKEAAAASNNTLIEKFSLSMIDTASKTSSKTIFPFQVFLTGGFFCVIFSFVYWKKGVTLDENFERQKVSQRSKKRKR